ncbi:MAG: N-methyl-L-tryptophan oxidase [Saprospiraceae bacterium]
MPDKFDVIVIGVGTMGVPACLYLAQRGLKVLGIEQFDIPNDHASHSGYTRIIRKAYYEHPDYVPLLIRSYELWKELEYNSGIKLYHETGILYLGEESSPVLQGCLESSRLYQIPVESWSRSKTKEKFPHFQYPEDWISLWEPEAGYLHVNESIQSFYKAALQQGASFQTNEKVEAWTQTENGIEVKTDKGFYLAHKIIFTSGSWTQDHLPNHKLPLTVTRQMLAWLDMSNSAYYSSPHFPCWFVHDPEKGMYYGFPDSNLKNQAEPPGIKIGLHVRGELTSPSTIERSIGNEDEKIVDLFIERYFPQGQGVQRSYKTCMYTNTPDENFILDYLHDTNQQVVLACGFSGHGFKFAPVIGELLAQMVCNESSDLNIDFLRLNRFNHSTL